jgi:hypothetical protein
MSYPVILATDGGSQSPRAQLERLKITLEGLLNVDLRILCLTKDRVLIMLSLKEFADSLLSAKTQLKEVYGNASVPWNELPSDKDVQLLPQDIEPRAANSLFEQHAVAIARELRADFKTRYPSLANSARNGRVAVLHFGQRLRRCSFFRTVMPQEFPVLSGRMQVSLQNEGVVRVSEETAFTSTAPLDDLLRFLLRREANGNQEEIIATWPEYALSSRLLVGQARIKGLRRFGTFAFACGPLVEKQYDSLLSLLTEGILKMPPQPKTTTQESSVLTEIMNAGEDALGVVMQRICSGTFVAQPTASACAAACRIALSPLHHCFGSLCAALIGDITNNNEDNFLYSVFSAQVGNAQLAAHPIARAPNVWATDGQPYSAAFKNRFVASWIHFEFKLWETAATYFAQSCGGRPPHDTLPPQPDQVGYMALAEWVRVRAGPAFGRFAALCANNAQAIPLALWCPCLSKIFMGQALLDCELFADVRGSQSHLLLRPTWTRAPGFNLPDVFPTVSGHRNVPRHFSTYATFLSSYYDYFLRSLDQTYTFFQGVLGTYEGSSLLGTICLTTSLTQQSRPSGEFGPLSLMGLGKLFDATPFGSACSPDHYDEIRQVLVKNTSDIRSYFERFGDLGRRVRDLLKQPHAYRAIVNQLDQRIGEATRICDALFTLDGAASDPFNLREEVEAQLRNCRLSPGVPWGAVWNDAHRMFFSPSVYGSSMSTVCTLGRMAVHGRARIDNRSHRIHRAALSKAADEVASRFFERSVRRVLIARVLNVATGIAGSMRRGDKPFYAGRPLSGQWLAPPPQKRPTFGVFFVDAVHLSTADPQLIPPWVSAIVSLDGPRIIGVTLRGPDNSPVWNDERDMNVYNSPDVPWPAAYADNWAGFQPTGYTHRILRILAAQSASRQLELIFLEMLRCASERKEHLFDGDIAVDARLAPGVHFRFDWLDRNDQPLSKSARDFIQHFLLNFENGSCYLERNASVSQQAWQGVVECLQAELKSASRSGTSTGVQDWNQQLVSYMSGSDGTSITGRHIDEVFVARGAMQRVHAPKVITEPAWHSYDVPCLAYPSDDLKPLTADEVFAHLSCCTLSPIAIGPPTLPSNYDPSYQTNTRGSFLRYPYVAVNCVDNVCHVANPPNYHYTNIGRDHPLTQLAADIRGRRNNATRGAILAGNPVDLDLAELIKQLRSFARDRNWETSIVLTPRSVTNLRTAITALHSEIPQTVEVSAWLDAGRGTVDAMYSLYESVCAALDEHSFVTGTIWRDPLDPWYTAVRAGVSRHPRAVADNANARICRLTYTPSSAFVRDPTTPESMTQEAVPPDVSFLMGPVNGANADASTLFQLSGMTSVRFSPLTEYRISSAIADDFNLAGGGPAPADGLAPITYIQGNGDPAVPVQLGNGDWWIWDEHRFSWRLPTTVADVDVPAYATPRGFLPNPVLHEENQYPRPGVYNRNREQIVNLFCRGGPFPNAAGSIEVACFAALQHEVESNPGLHPFLPRLREQGTYTLQELELNPDYFHLSSIIGNGVIGL